MMFSREAITASDTEAATPPRMASTTNRRFRRGVIFSLLTHRQRAQRALPCLGMIAARRPQIPGKYGTGKAEARPDITRVAPHGPKSPAAQDFTASRTQLA